MIQSPHKLGLIAGINAIKEGMMTCEEWIADCLSRIDERDATVKAWVHLDSDQARSAAKTIHPGPLHGAPIGIKDLIDTAVMPTSYGSPIYKNHQPKWDASCVTELRTAGAVILGKTVTTEFAYFGPGPTTNPHDTECTPGGSSSGSASAVADFQIPVALGTQTAGSIIRPAAFCGIVGYKPSSGMLPLSGIRPLALSMDHLGILARDVDDAAFIASILARRPSLALTSDKRSCPPSPRIGFCRTHDWMHAEASTREIIEKSIDLFANHGAEITEIELPEPFIELGDAQNLTMSFEVSQSGIFEYTHHKSEISKAFQEKVEAGLAVSENELNHAALTKASCNALLPEVMQDVDVLVCPSTVGEAPKGLASTGDPRFNRAWTYLGVPCINVPGLTGPNGRPLGLQVIGRLNDDHRALLAAKWLLHTLGNHITCC